MVAAGVFIVCGEEIMTDKLDLELDMETTCLASRKSCRVRPPMSAISRRVTTSSAPSWAGSSPPIEFQQRPADRNRRLRRAQPALRRQLQARRRRRRLRARHHAQPEGLNVTRYVIDRPLPYADATDDRIGEISRMAIAPALPPPAFRPGQAHPG